MITDASQTPKFSDEEIFFKIANTIVKRGVTLPAILFLETMKPLNFIGAQMLVFFGPFLESLIPGEQLYRFTELMEDRKSVDKLLAEIERLEDEKKEREKTDPNKITLIQKIKNKYSQWRN